MSTKKPNLAELKSNKQEKRESISLSSDSGTQSPKKSQKLALQKLANSFASKKKKKDLKNDSWFSLIQNLLDTQRGKLPLLIAIESGNQSMVRELLSQQTAEQLRVSIGIYFNFLFHIVSTVIAC